MLACVSSCCGSGTGHYSTNLFGAEAVKIITAHKPTTPLFFYLPWQGVHAPAQVREPAHGKEDWSAFDHEKAPLEDSSRLAKCNGLIQINFVDWLDFCVEIGSRALHQALRKSHCRPRPTVRFLFMTATGTHVPILTRFGSPKSAKLCVSGFSLACSRLLTTAWETSRRRLKPRECGRQPSSSSLQTSERLPFSQSIISVAATLFHHHLCAVHSYTVPRRAVPCCAVSVDSGAPITECGGIGGSNVPLRGCSE